MRKILSRFKYQIILFLITLIIFLLNYKSGTSLTGWDNLQSELNPWLSVKRAFFSVWQEYQSFGLVAGMAHASDLIRALFIFFLSFFLPQNLIRYFYHSLMLFIGGLGMMKLLRDSRFRGNDREGKNDRGSGDNKQETQSFQPSDERERVEKSLKDSSTLRVGGLGMTDTYAFIGAIFYMLNLGTVQIFYLPFEPFSTFFAFLPWGIWSFLHVISNEVRNPAKRKFTASGLDFSAAPRNDWLVFFLINLLGTPAFYTQQLFVVYLFVLGCIAIGYFLCNFSIQKNAHYVLRSTFHVFIAFLIIGVINSFWLLPQTYFLKTNSRVVYQSKQNQLATEDTYYQNKEKGTITHLLKLEGFYYDLFDKNNQPLFKNWQDHFRKFSFIQYFFALLMILGIIKSIKKKDFILIPLLIFLSIIFLNNTFPFNLIDSTFRQFRFYNQIFRSPFTKFIIPYSLVYSYFVIRGIKFIDSRFCGNDKYAKSFFGLFILFLIFFYSFPVFKGYFFSPEMKVKIPEEYLNLIDYFKKEDKNKRIALLPEYTFWGWYQYRWSYNGSGFLWYGIEQPIVSRTFDTWSKNSESYFWEIKTAIELENLEKFEKILEKYQIDYLLFDYSLKPIVGTPKIIANDRIENLINQSKKINLIQKNQFFSLYQVKNKLETKNFISLINNLPTLSPKIIDITNEDSAFSTFGHYINENQNPQYYFPFLDLTSVKRLDKKEWSLEETDNYFVLNFSSNINLNNYQIENFFPVYQAILLDNNQPKNFSTFINYKINNNQGQFFINKTLIKKIQNTDFIFSQCALNTQCYSIFLPFFDQKYGYLMKIKNQNLKGRRLFFYLLDETKKQTLIEERLKSDEEYFFIPEKFAYGQGYSLVFLDRKYQGIANENLIEEVDFYLFPNKNLKELYFQKKETNHNQTNYVLPLDVKKNNYFSYELRLENLNQIETIFLSQSYDPGWQAYIIKNDHWLAKIFPFIFGERLKEHVLINNWANGWRLDEASRAGQKLVTTSSTNSTSSTSSTSSTNLIIIFWPQYLQFLGFVLMVVGFIYILKFKH